MVNKVFIVGRVGQDPKIKDSSVSLSVATSESYIKEGKKVENTQWHNVTVFGKTQEYVKNYIGKGDLLLIEGKITYLENKEKNTKTTFINALRIQTLKSNSNERSKQQNTKEELASKLSNDFGNPLDEDVPF